MTAEGTRIPRSAGVSPWRRVQIALIAFAMVLVLASLTQVIQIGGARWYSTNPALRRQTEAFLHGQTSLGNSPDGLALDLVWYHGIQQVWGLGVPAFRLPFEIIAKLFGLPGFPDRIVFLAACFLTWVLLIATVWPSRANWRWFFTSPTGVGAAWVVAILAFAPAFVTLLKTRFEVYEEVAAYAFLFSLLLFLSLARLQRRPAPANLAAVAVLCGAGAFVRPTLFIYGVVTFGLALIFSRHARLPWKYLILAAALFAAVTATVCLSNYQRFGAVAEFGHNLNLSPVPEHGFSMKFDYPFRHVSPLSALGDLAGSLSGLGKLNGCDFYAKEVVPLQSGTLRWHEMYFNVFTPVDLALFLASLLFCRRHILPLGAAPACNPPGAEFKQPRPASTFAAVATPWSAASFAGIFLFYLYSPCVSSRYNIDFLAPVMVAVSTLVWLLFDREPEGIKPRSSQRIEALSWLTFVWLVCEIGVATILFTHQHTNPLNYSEAFPRATPAANQPANFSGGEYLLGDTNKLALIPLNGCGWDVRDGTVATSVMLFATEPECVALTLQSAGGGPLRESDVRHVRAKIGLEHLATDSILITTNGATVTFQGPKQARYQSGLQICFLAFGALEALDKKPSRFRLSKVGFKRPVAAPLPSSISTK